MGVKTSDGSGNQGGDGKSTGTGDQGGDTKTDDGKTGDGKGDDGKGGQKDGEGKDELDLASLPESVQKHIKDLRKENAKHRTKANKLESDFASVQQRLKALAGGEDDGEQLTPEQQIAQLEAGVGQYAFRNACLSLALEHGIGKDGYEYFEYLVGKAVEGLEDGEELDDEVMTGLISEAKAKSGAGSKQTTTTSVNPKSGDGKAPDTKAEVSLDQFVKMSIGEKSALYNKNPALYDALTKEAKDKRILVK